MGLIWILGAAAWGVAEATVFFIVPDVLLTLAVFRFGLRCALRLSVIAAASASLAGIAMWFWGHGDAASARHAMLLVPAIGPHLLARAAQEMKSGWPLHLVLGAVTGVPYKLYAIEAGANGINPVLFAAMSFPARFTRFVLTAAVAAVGRAFANWIELPHWGYPGWALVWIAVYAFYFSMRAGA